MPYTHSQVLSSVVAFSKHFVQVSKALLQSFTIIQRYGAMDECDAKHVDNLRQLIVKAAHCLNPLNKQLVRLHFAAAALLQSREEVRDFELAARYQKTK